MRQYSAKKSSSVLKKHSFEAHANRENISAKLAENNNPQIFRTREGQMKIWLKSVMLIGHLGMKHNGNGIENLRSIYLFET